MARVFMPEEELSVHYLTLKDPLRKTLSARRRRVGLIVCAVFAILFLLVILRISTGIFRYTDILHPVSATHETDDLQIVSTSTSAGDISARIIPYITTPTTAAPDRPGDLNWSRKLPIDQWGLFLNEAVPATRVPPALDVQAVKLLLEAKNKRVLYLEVHEDKEYCLAVILSPNALKPEHESFNPKFPQQFAIVNFKEYFKQLNYNLTAPDDLFELNLNEVYGRCRGRTVIPVRQVKEMPSDRYFVE